MPLDGVADGALHPAGGGAVFLGDFRVEALGHGVDIFRLVHGEQDGIPQELLCRFLCSQSFPFAAHSI